MRNAINPTVGNAHLYADYMRCQSAAMEAALASGDMAAFHGARVETEAARATMLDVVNTQRGKVERERVYKSDARRATMTGTGLTLAAMGPPLPKQKRSVPKRASKRRKQ